MGDPDARAFAAGWMVRRDETIGIVSYVVGLPFHLAAIVVEPFITYEPYVLPMRVAHAAILGVHLLWLLALRPRGIPGRHLIFACQVATATAFAAIGYGCQHAPNCQPTQLAGALMSFIGFALCLMILLPYHKPKAICGAVAIYSAMSVWILQGNWQISTYLPIMIIGLMTAAGMRLGLSAWTYVEALREYAVRRQIAPLTVVRRSTDDPRSIDAVFAPELRQTVCVSTDWRNYQSLSSILTPEALAAALNSYYDMCARLLAEVAPNGDYYSDWIADELFIVFFAPTPESHAEVCCEALRFAERLLEEKAKFIVHHKHPRAIDIGVAAGRALVGMMGPASHRKATALGEVPGRARRLQIVGKKLRAVYGDRDRVVFGNEVQALVGNNWSGVETFLVPTTEKLRDLDDVEIHFLGGGAVPSQLRSA